MRCIVAATDGSESGDRAVDFAADLASKFGVDLNLVNVISAPTAVAETYGRAGPLPDKRTLISIEGASPSEVLENTAKDILAKAKGRAEARGARSVRTETRAGEPAEMILSDAKERGADVIVLGKRGRGRLAGLLLGSVSQKVAMLAPCAVLVVP
jgi:nucleotide-binding universal stress UspA family protein